MDENYLFNVEQKIINQSGLMFEAYPYGSSNRKGEPEMQKFFILHEGPISITTKERVKEKGKKIKEMIKKLNFL